MLIGKSASYGIGIARALVLENTNVVLETDKAKDVDYELHRFDEALKSSL